MGCLEIFPKSVMIEEEHLVEYFTCKWPNRQMREKLNDKALVLVTIPPGQIVL